MAVGIFTILARPSSIRIVVVLRENVTSCSAVWLKISRLVPRFGSPLPGLEYSDVRGDAISALKAASGISADGLTFPSVPLSNAALAYP